MSVAIHHAHTDTMTSEKTYQPASFDPFQPRVDVGKREHHTARTFCSTRLRGDHPKPWLTKIDKRMVWSTVILYCGAIFGIGLGVAIAWLDLRNAPLAKFCESPYWEDDFSTFDPEKWTREVQLNGFGTGSFDWTTTDATNSYVDAAGLHIVPTLTTEATNITIESLTNGYTLNLTQGGGDGSCTAPDDWNYNKACSVTSNSTLNTIINPVRSARLTTKKSLKMRYGRVEVDAKLPAGDWLWPAIWMMPSDSVYGEWPRSGEIDIMESRGNSPETYSEGRDMFTSTIHWGPNALLDAYWRKTVSAREWRNDFASRFHTYSIEWTPNYIFTYYDNKLSGLLYAKFGDKRGNMWEQGDFSGTYVNGSNVYSPWQGRGPNAPFDQEFYLILNVAVGGTNGFFEDGACYTNIDTGERYCDGDKPWRNDSPRAMLDFWNSKEVWYPTWAEGDKKGMTVRSVRAYKYGDC